MKTSLSSHLAGLAAAAGWKVLLVDSDAQGNTSRDLGYVPDGGVNLAKALMGEAPLRPIQDPRRPGLSYVSGGPALDGALTHLSSELSQGKPAAMRAFERALEPIASSVHLVVVDTPPRELLLRRLVLTSAKYFVVPTGIDAAGIDGIANLLETVSEVRQESNPELEMLGIAIGPIAKQATRVRESIRQEIAELLGDPDIVFQTTIRSAPSIAKTCRDEGLLSHEYEHLAQLAAEDRKSYWAMTEEERAADRHATKYSSAADGLASDWQSLVEEILGRFSDRINSEQAA